MISDALRKRLMLAVGRYTDTDGGQAVLSRAIQNITLHAEQAKHSGQ